MSQRTIINKSRSLTLAAVVAAACFGLVSAPSAAVAGPADHAGNKCYKTSCDFKDPKEMGCAATASTPSSGGTVYANSEFTGSQVKIEYRHSWGCRASWARLTLLNDEAPDCFYASRGLAGFHRRHYYSTGNEFNSNSLPHENCTYTSWTYMTGDEIGRAHV